MVLIGGAIPNGEKGAFTMKENQEARCRCESCIAGISLLVDERWLSGRNGMENDCTGCRDCDVKKIYPE